MSGLSFGMTFEVSTYAKDENILLRTILPTLGNQLDAGIFCVDHDDIRFDPPFCERKCGNLYEGKVTFYPACNVESEVIYLERPFVRENVQIIINPDNTEHTIQTDPIISPEKSNINEHPIGWNEFVESQTTAINPYRSQEI